MDVNLRYQIAIHSSLLVPDFGSGKGDSVTGPVKFLISGIISYVQNNIGKKYYSHSSIFPRLASLTKLSQIIYTLFTYVDLSVDLTCLYSVVGGSK